MNINNKNINYQNGKTFPPLQQPLVIYNIADRLSPRSDFANLKAHSIDQIRVYAQNLIAFMLTCKGIGSKQHLQKKYFIIKECYLKKRILFWNKKYPVYANEWNLKSNKDLDKFFSPQPLENANDIQEQFGLIRQPQVILKVIEQAHPQATDRLNRKLYVWPEDGRNELIQTINALLQTCKAFYNCKTLQNFNSILKKSGLEQTRQMVILPDREYNLPGGPGWLNDIFLTSWHGYYYGQIIGYIPDQPWGIELAKDMRKIVKEFPESLLCCTLHTRDLMFIDPFSMACMNQNIPLPEIKFLLENKADANRCALAGCLPWHWINKRYYIEKENEPAQQRFKEIVKLVKDFKFNFRTEVLVDYDSGFGHNLFIRGSRECGLSWQKSKPLINLSANRWIYIFPSQKTFNFEFKILIDDETWERDVSQTQQNHKGTSGQQLCITPYF